MRLGDDVVDPTQVFALVRDPDEGPRFAPFLAGRPVRPDERAGYQAWLLARGDARGELLALSEALAAGPGTDAQRARLRALVATVDPAWWALVRAPRLQLHCGAARDQAPAVRFAFRCPKVWEELTPTDAPGVRHCDGCGERVYQAETVIAAATLARAGHCISVPSAIVERAGYPDGPPRAITGRPAHPAVRWGERVFADDT